MADTDVSKFNSMMTDTIVPFLDLGYKEQFSTLIGSLIVGLLVIPVVLGVVIAATLLFSSFIVGVLVVKFFMAIFSFCCEVEGSEQYD